MRLTLIHLLPLLVGSALAVPRPNAALAFEGEGQSLEAREEHLIGTLAAREANNDLDIFARDGAALEERSDHDNDKRDNLEFMTRDTEDLDERTVDELEERDDDFHQHVRRGALGAGAKVTAASSASSIKALQYLLGGHGQTLDKDGKFGPKTKAAIVAFQKQAKLAADGVAGPATLGALVATIRPGSTGSLVMAVQAMVGVGVDGKFGPATKAAVVSFQGSHGLAKDGVVGPATWTALFGGGGSTNPTTPPTGGSCDSVRAGVPISQTAMATNGIRVNKCLVSRINAMVAAAARDGVTLRPNSSWRDPKQQIALRRKNCGTSHYDIYQKPSRQCHPQTAIPGSSRHERGLAIDFANCAKGSRVYNWLKANAGKYHLQILRSGTESWHWSWDGY